MKISLNFYPVGSSQFDGGVGVLSFFNFQKFEQIDKALQQSSIANEIQAEVNATIVLLYQLKITANDKQLVKQDKISDVETLLAQMKGHSTNLTTLNNWMRNVKLHRANRCNLRFVHGIQQHY